MDLATSIGSSDVAQRIALQREEVRYPPGDLAIWIFILAELKARRGGYSAARHTGVETGASYWHMVDLVWLILFPLVYVMR